MLGLQEFAETSTHRGYSARLIDTGTSLDSKRLHLMRQLHCVDPKQGMIKELGKEGIIVSA